MRRKYRNQKKTKNHCQSTAQDCDHPAGKRRNDILDRTHGHNDRNIHSCPKFDSCLFRPFHNPFLLSPGGNNNQEKHSKSHTADICIDPQCHTENITNQIACHVAACQKCNSVNNHFFRFLSLLSSFFPSDFASAGTKPFHT